MCSCFELFQWNHATTMLPVLFHCKKIIISLPNFISQNTRREYLFLMLSPHFSLAQLSGWRTGRFLTYCPIIPFILHDGSTHFLLSRPHHEPDDERADFSRLSFHQTIDATEGHLFFSFASHSSGWQADRFLTFVLPSDSVGDRATYFLSFEANIGWWADRFLTFLSSHQCSGSRAIK